MVRDCLTKFRHNSKEINNTQVSASKLMQRRKYSEVEPTRYERDPVMRVPSLHLPLLLGVGGERIHFGPKCPSYQSENLSFNEIRFDT